MNIQVETVDQPNRLRLNSQKIRYERAAVVRTGKHKRSYQDYTAIDHLQL
jgi:hypothetical protein